MTGDATPHAAWVRSALRLPRGRYPVGRASQLSGIPERTLYHWASTELLVPDWAGHRPKQWSYRDLVFLRLVAWLRARGMAVDAVRQRIAALRRRVEAGDDAVLRVRGDSRTMLVGGDAADKLSGEAPLPGLETFLEEFLLTDLAGAPEMRGADWWGPDLRRPSERTSISPSVMGGDVCVRQTRMPTSSLYALHAVRRLPHDAIVALYPSLEKADVEDAVDLEERLRRPRLTATARRRARESATGETQHALAP